jgi:hypothetical protein
MNAFQAATTTIISAILGLTIVSTAMILTDSEGSVILKKDGPDLHFDLERNK